MPIFKMPFFTKSGATNKQYWSLSSFSGLNNEKHKVESSIEDLIEKFQNSKPESVLNEMQTVLQDQRILIEQLLQERSSRLKSDLTKSIDNHQLVQPQTSAAGYNWRHFETRTSAAGYNWQHGETRTSEADDTRRHVETRTSKAYDTRQHVETQTSEADDTRRHVETQTSEADDTRRHVETQTSEAHTTETQTQTRYIHNPPYKAILADYRWMQDNNLYLNEDNVNIKYENDQLKHSIDELKNKLTSRIPQDYIYQQPFIQPVLQKKVCVEIYVPAGSEVVHSMVDTLKRDLQSKLLNENIILDFIMVSTGQKLLKEPSIVLCPSFSRLGTDVKSVFAGLQDSGKGTVLVVIHYREEHNLPKVKSEQILSDYNRLRVILDMAYINNKGFYNCNLNHNSFDGLTSFLINYAK